MASSGFELLLRATPAFAPAALHGLFATCAIRVLNPGVKKEYIDGTRPFVAVLWHDHVLFHVAYFRRRNTVILVSRSRDGELVAKTLERLGYRTARGSSSSGGGEALRELVALVRRGYGAAFIADGPRGPAKIAKIGCVIAARDSGAPLLPIACHTLPALTLKNWDRTVVPWPMARIAVAFGDPIPVPPGATREECEGFRSRMDRVMARLESDCRRALGVK